MGLGGGTCRVTDEQHARYMGQEIASPFASFQRREGMQHQWQPAESEEALSGQKTEAYQQPAAIAPMTDQRVACM